MLTLYATTKHCVRQRPILYDYIKRVSWTPFITKKNPRHPLLCYIKAILFHAIDFTISDFSSLKFEMNDADARILKGLRAYWQ